MFRTLHGGKRIVTRIKSQSKTLLPIFLAVAVFASTANFAAPVSANSGISPKANSGAQKNIPDASKLEASKGGSIRPYIFAPTTFSNTTAIAIPGSGTGSGTGTAAAANPYPSNIAVSGLSGTITDVNVTLTNLSHSDTTDIDVLLVGPNGEKFTLMSDTGASGPVSNVTLTLDDAAAAGLPNGTAAMLTTGTYKPTDRDGGTGTVEDITFPAPAPAMPYSEPAPAGTDTLASTFNGHNANGTWSLYVVDDASTNTGSISGGWSLSIDVAASAVATTTTIASSQNPSLRNQPVTFTATVKKTSDSTNVTEGTVTFTENGVNLSCTEGAQPRPVNVSGQATCTVAANGFTEGNHNITATYNGTVNFATSNASLTQVVDNPTTVNGNEFCNTGAITIPTSLPVTPYPSRIFVTGLSGSISKVTVDLKNLSHTNPDDLDILLVGPGGEKVLLMSDAGGTADVSNINVTFDDAFPLIPDGGPLASGSYKPSDYSPADTFPAPAPAGPYSSLLSAFNGTSANGTWSLYVFDDGTGADAGQIAGGWCLDFTTTSDAPTTTTVSGSPNPSLTTQAVTFTANVVKTSDSTPVTSGTVTFTEGATTLTCTEGAQPRPVNGSGQATCTVAGGTLSEGAHNITATYNGDPGFFNTSSGSTTQIVNNPTTVTGNEFCNTGSIAIPAPSPAPPPSGAPARPYPSNILVSGLSGTIAKVTVELNGITHTNPDDIDVLLVGPNGQKIILMADAGGDADVSNVNLTFDDAAAGGLPDNTTLTSGTYKPTNHAAPDSDTFPAPAPSGPYSPALTVFDTTNPNGTWSLYVVDDAGGDVGSIANGWCLNFTLNNPSTVSISDSSLPEPTSGSANMVFTVYVTPAPTTAMNVNFTTEPDPVGPNPATAGSDYTPTSGTLNFAAGQSVQTISVPILSDAVSEPNETFIVHLTGITGGSPGSSIADDKATGTITPPGTAPVAQLLISELRSSGPTSADNDFVEVYNNSYSPFTVPAGGYGLYKSGATCTDTPVLIGTIPAATTIAPHGHFLFVGTGYSLAGYAGGNQTLTSNIEDDRNIGLFSTVSLAGLSSATRLDAVGFGTNLVNNCDLLREGSPVAATSGSSSEYSVVRRMETGFPQDTNSNTTDFFVLSTTPNIAVGSTPTPRLGAPGPENLASPVLKLNSQLQSLLVDPTKGPDAAPNRTRDAASYTDTLTPSAPNGGAPASNPYTLGTLSVHRRFVNQTGAPVTRLRFRVVDITTLNSPNVTPVGAQADIRLLSSNGVTRAPAMPAGVSLKGLTLEQPPTQPFAGGWNSSVSAGTITLAQPLPAVDDPNTPQFDHTIDVQFLLGVASSGKFRFIVIVEALP
jgi:subtilisin-like proprotein convertase family protein